MRVIERDAVPAIEQPRWRTLPPEIVHMIMAMLGADKESLNACSLVSHEFTFAALCCLGRHITISAVSRLRDSISLLTKHSAFQHVRSLDLGITTRRAISRRDWDDYLVVLEAFARRRTLTRLWLSRVPFHFCKHAKNDRAENVIASLAATVNELGLYSCSFSSYAEMLSLIRAFPLCASLYVHNCIAQRTKRANAFAGLPQHTLHIRDLELISLSGKKSLISISSLVEDAALDTSSLTDFSCGMNAADIVRCTLMTAAASPIERLQLICDEAHGFHVLADPAITAWPLRSLTIGPLFQKDIWWCERALEFSPNLPYLENITIFARCKAPVPFFLGFWTRIDQLLSRGDLFPRLKQLDICIDVNPRRLGYPGHSRILRYLSNLREAGKVYFWGEKLST